MRVQGERWLSSLAWWRGEGVGAWRSRKCVWHRRTSSEEVGGGGGRGRVKWEGSVVDSVVAQGVFCEEEVPLQCRPRGEKFAGGG